MRFKIIAPVFCLGLLATCMATGCSRQTATTPSIAGEWQISAATADSGIFAGASGRIQNQDYLFLATLSDSSEQTMLRVLSLQSPQNPVEVGSLSLVDSNAAGSAVPVLDMGLSGNLLCISDMSSMLIVDVSNPSSPVELSQFTQHSAIAQIAVSNGYAFMATPQNTIAVDISDAANPELAGTLDLAPASLRGFEVYGSSLFAIAADGLHIIDISNPSSMQETGFIPNPVDAQGTQASFGYLALDGQYAYMTAGTSGLYIFDISDLSSPREIASLPSDGQAGLISVSGGLACVIDWKEPAKIGDTQYWLNVVDISNPEKPEQLASLGLPSNSQSSWFVESDNYIYWFGTGPALTIVNLTAGNASS